MVKFLKKLLKEEKEEMNNCCEERRPIDYLAKDKNEMKMFRRFLQSEFSEENIEFWVACEQFKKISGKSRRASKANKIYEKFIEQDSPNQVNIDSATRSAICSQLSSPQPDLFQKAQKRIQSLMENDSYRRFIDSDSYRRAHSCSAR